MDRSSTTKAVGTAPGMSSTNYWQTRAGVPEQRVMHRAEFDEPEFLTRLRNGDPQAYERVIKHLHGSLIGLATSIIGSHAQAEEVVQDTWMAVFTGIAEFRGDARLSTWVFRILLNRARTRAAREARLTGLSAMMEADRDGAVTVEISKSNEGRRMVVPPQLRDEMTPERIVADQQLYNRILEAAGRLPVRQRAVFVLRDIEGRGSQNACALLGIIATTERQWLHRARTCVRRAINSAINVSQSRRGRHEE